MTTPTTPTEQYPELTRVGWTEEAALSPDAPRHDGFRLVRCQPAGWNIAAPNGQLFAWALTEGEVEEKVEREKKERLWS